MRCRTLVACLVATSSLASPLDARATGRPVAQATAGDKQQAQKAYVAALANYKKGHLEDALSGFRASYDVVASPNSHIMVVNVLVDLGRSAEAYTEAELVAEEATASGPDYKAAADAARASMTKLLTHIGLLTIDIDKSASATALRVNDRSIEPARWSTPVAVAPGKVTVELTTARGVESKHLEMAAFSVETVKLGAPAPTAVPPASAVAATSNAVPTMRVAGFAAGGIGALGLVTFAVLGSMSSSTFDDLEQSCKGGVCPASRAGDIDGGRSQQTVANIGAAVGALGLAAGITLVTLSYTSRSKADDGATPASSATVHASLGLGSVALRGSF